MSVGDEFILFCLPLCMFKNLHNKVFVLQNKIIVSMILKGEMLQHILEIQEQFKDAHTLIQPHPKGPSQCTKTK